MGSRFAFSRAAEVQELLRDVLAPQRLLLNHLEVASEHLSIGCTHAGRRCLVRCRQHFKQPAFQGFGAEEDAGQWVVDFVGDTGCEEADRDHPLAANELPAALVDLPGQVGVDRRQPGRHRVEFVGEFLELVAGGQANGMLEVAAVDACYARLKLPDGREHPDTEVVEEGQDERDRPTGCYTDNPLALADGLVRLPDSSLDVINDGETQMFRAAARVFVMAANFVIHVQGLGSGAIASRTCLASCLFDRRLQLLEFGIELVDQPRFLRPSSGSRPSATVWTLVSRSFPR